MFSPLLTAFSLILKKESRGTLAFNSKCLACLFAQKKAWLEVLAHLGELPLAFMASLEPRFHSVSSSLFLFFLSASRLCEPNDLITNQPTNLSSSGTHGLRLSVTWRTRWRLSLWMSSVRCCVRSLRCSCVAAATGTGCWQRVKHIPEPVVQMFSTLMLLSESVMPWPVTCTQCLLSAPAHAFVSCFLTMVPVRQHHKSSFPEHVNIPLSLGYGQ